MVQVLFMRVVLSRLQLFVVFLSSRRGVRVWPRVFRLREDDHFYYIDEANAQRSSLPGC